MRNKNGESTDGFILADVLAALVIAAIALSSILIGVIHAAGVVSVQTERVIKLVDRENDQAAKSLQLFTAGE